MVRPAQQHESIPEKDNWSVPKSMRTLAQSDESGSVSNLSKYQALAYEDNGENCSSTEEHMSKTAQMGTYEAEKSNSSVDLVDTQAEEVKQLLNPNSWADQMEREEEEEPMLGPNQLRIGDFHNIVKESWEKPLEAAPLFNLMIKLRRLKTDIKGWKKQGPDRNKTVQRDLENEMLSMQMQLETYHTNDDIDTRMRIKGKKLQVLDIIEELEWKQRSKAKWLTAGDRNTSYFQATAKMKAAKMMITEKKTGEDRLLQNQSHIKEYIVDYFTNKFKKQDVIDDGLLFNSINTQLNEEENNILIFCPAKEEIQAANIFGGESPPGQDGFPGCFFQRYWEIIAAGLKNLRNLLIKYQRASGQTISLDKSKIFMDGVPFTRRRIVKGIFGFKEGLLPQTYLGIPLIQGRVKKQTIRPLVEHIRRRANGWSGMMLSFQGRVVLAKSILNSIPIYNMGIYKWPQSLIMEGDTIIRNFIWTGDPTKRRAIILKWDKVCKPTKGGLGIRSLNEINNAMLCKLNWLFKEGKKTWAQMLGEKFKNQSGDIISYHKSSSIWPGIKMADEISKDHMEWQIGDGTQIDFWRDRWAAQTPLREHIDLPKHLWSQTQIKVCCDGAAMGNPGHAEVGIINRYHNSTVMGTFSKPIGNQTNYIAECNEIFHEVQKAGHKGWKRLWVVSDSKAAIQAFRNNKLPWRLQTQWNILLSLISTIRFSQILRD
ncbi:hypothetical protein GIB67_017535 [Kingdonia uniflora]|uniref:RNase H type-1 domain-containing protein n=1 Tax=Kingdonia uniflora TaxID=39325 RepID=A0A7J7M4N1_9MAGN|nr:hypothetical protein GIB67_017535 [Kingdonia uniflora]